MVALRRVALPLKGLVAVAVVRVPLGLMLRFRWVALAALG
jgi:hypothetical protein